jgi:hypothetical protein
LKLYAEHIIRKTDNPYSKGSKIFEVDFIAGSFFYDMRPQPEMFELKQLAAIPKSQIEKRHDYMLSVIKDRIDKTKKYEEGNYSGYGRSLHGRDKGVSHISSRRRVMKGCKHKPIPEIEEAIYHITENKERQRRYPYTFSGTKYDMWDNPTN